MTQPGGRRRPRVLLTFTGFHDPYSPGSVEGGEQEGPVLSLIRAHPVDSVVLLSTPNTIEQTEATDRAIRERHPRVETEIRHFALDDPTNYFEILTELRAQFQDIWHRLGQVAYFVGTASEL